jgi:hypothetical protein
MAPKKIVDLGEFLVVGMPYLGKNEHGEIAKMWGEFVPRIGEIKHQTASVYMSYGVCMPNAGGWSTTWPESQ